MRISSVVASPVVVSQFGTSRKPVVAKKVTGQQALTQRERTVIHEFGHAIWGLLLEKRLLGIDIDNDREGNAYSYTQKSTNKDDKARYDAIELIHNLGGISFEENMALSSRVQRSKKKHQNPVYVDVIEKGDSDIESIFTLLKPYKGFKNNEQISDLIVATLASMADLFNKINKDNLLMLTMEIPNVVVGHKTLKKLTNEIIDHRQFETYKRKQVAKLLDTLTQSLIDAR
ncbi:MAG: hypothetical protein U0003_00315 [Vampirovibrionales bacterium]